MSRNTLMAVAPIAPAPADNGYSVRVAGILGELGQLWDTVLVAPAVATGVESGIESRLLDYVSVDLGGRVATMPWELDVQALQAAVTSAVRRYEPQAALLWSGTEVLGFERDFVPSVADRIDSATLAALRMTNSPSSLMRRLRRAARAARYERRVVRRMSATVVVGEDDARVLRTVSGRRSVHVVPNGVDLGPLPEPSWEDETPTVIFTGVMNFHPNTDAVISFAHDVWPLVHEAIPGARFVIAGRDPRDTVLELERLEGVRVRPDVPDLRSEQRKAWLAVAPMRAGCGIKNKILEAWACGKPVIMSSLAANGLADGHEDAGAIADSPREFAREVIRLLRDDDERRRLGRNGYRLAGKFHSWSGAAGRISELLDVARRGKEGVPPRRVPLKAAAESARR